MKIQDETGRVVDQKVGEEAMENYMASKLLEIEEQKIDLLKADVLIKGYKQLNVRHKNIIDAQRMQIKVKEVQDVE